MDINNNKHEYYPDFLVVEVVVGGLEVLVDAVEGELIEGFVGLEEEGGDDEDVEDEVEGHLVEDGELVLGVGEVVFGVADEVEEDEYELVDADEEEGGDVVVDELAEGLGDGVGPLEVEELESGDAGGELVDDVGRGDEEEEGEDDEVDVERPPDEEAPELVGEVDPVDVLRVWGLGAHQDVLLLDLLQPQHPPHQVLHRVPDHLQDVPADANR